MALSNVVSFPEFIIDILEREAPDERYYAYIARYSKEEPFWRLFMASDDEHGKPTFAGDYGLNYIDMEDMVNLLSVFANNGRKIIIDTERYFYEG